MATKSVLIGAIRACDSRKILEETFELFKVYEKEARIDILIEAMYKPQMFFSSGDVTLDQRYELTVEMFLSMTWKLNELYDKAGY